MKNLYAALEDAEDSVEEVVDQATVDTAVSETEEANEVIAEADASATELEESAEIIGDAVEETEKLEEVVEIMEEKVESGEGMDDTTAKMAEVAVESICANLGLDIKGQLPALESYEGSSTRLTSTNIAIESIKSWIIKTWEKIRKFIVDTFNKFIGFFKNFNNAEKAISGKVDKLLKRIDAFEKEQGSDPLRLPKNYEFEAETFDGIGPMVTPSKADKSAWKAMEVKGLSVMTATAHIENQLKKSTKDITSNITNIVDKKDPSDVSFNVPSLIKTFDKVKDFSVYSDKKESTETVSDPDDDKKREKTIKYYGPFPGYKILEVTSVDLGKGLFLNTAKFIGMDKKDIEKKGPVKFTQTFTFAEMRDNLKITVDKLKQLPSDGKNLNTLKDDQIKITDIIIKSAIKSKESDDKHTTEYRDNQKKLKQISRCLTSDARTAISMSGTVNKMILQMASSTVSFTNKLLDGYKKGNSENKKDTKIVEIKKPKP